jgi:hypothetical protein
LLFPIIRTEKIPTNETFDTSTLDRFKTILCAWQAPKKCLTVVGFDAMIEHLLLHLCEPFESLHKLLEAIFETGGFRSTPNSTEPIATWKSLIEQYSDVDVDAGEDQNIDVDNEQKYQLLWAFAIKSNCIVSMELMRKEGIRIIGKRVHDPSLVYTPEQFYINSFYGLGLFPPVLKGFLTNPGVFIEAIHDCNFNKFMILVTSLCENAIGNPIAHHLLDLGWKIIVNNGDLPTDLPTLPKLLKQLLESWYVSLY